MNTKFMIGAEFLALIIAGLAGVTMAFQGSINSALGKVVGLWEANFVVHVVGAILISFLLFVVNIGNGGIVKLVNAPWYTYLGGVLSVVIIYGVVRSIPKVGAAPATTAIIVGQVFTAAMVDHFGLFGLDRNPCNFTRLGIGLALLGAGTWVMLKK